MASRPGELLHSLTLLFSSCHDQRLWLGGVVVLGLVPDSDACVRQPAKHLLS